MIEPGEVYIADFAEAGPHPVIVISREALNRGRYALVVVCTSARFAARSTLPNCVPFQAGQFGFTAECVAQCENILSIDKLQLDLEAGPIGILDERALRDVIKAIGNVIDRTASLCDVLECEAQLAPLMNGKSSRARVNQSADRGS